MLIGMVYNVYAKPDTFTSMNTVVKRKYKNLNATIIATLTEISVSAMLVSLKFILEFVEHAHLSKHGMAKNVHMINNVG